MPKMITGGLGFIGSHLARKLVNLGEEVVLFDIISRTNLIEDIRQKVTIVRGDLGNWAQVLEAVKNIKLRLFIILLPCFQPPRRLPRWPLMMLMPTGPSTFWKPPNFSMCGA